MNTYEIATELKNSTNLLYQMSEKESTELKKILLDILKDIIEACEKHDIKYCLAGGSVLGAIRHKGFIPWDDDLDVFMLRKDCEKFINIFEEELSDRYILHAPNTTYDISHKFIKIEKKGTELIEMDTMNAPFFKGIYVDIFPIDYAPNSRLVSRLKGAVVDFVGVVGVSEYMYKFQNSTLFEFYNQTSKGKKYYAARLVLGKAASFMDYKKWYNLFDKISRGKKSKYMTVPSGRGHYMKERLPQQIFFPFEKGEFEGISVFLPHDADAYLKNLYGNYMQIPPLERERHYVVKLNLKEIESK